MGFEGDPCAYYGHRIIEEHHAKLRESIKGIPRMPTISTAGQDPKPGVVGILGAGVGGLYTAMMLESLGLKYEIIEASDRTGGRLYTHKFKGEGAKKYDYYVSTLLCFCCSIYKFIYGVGCRSNAFSFTRKAA